MPLQVTDIAFRRAPPHLDVTGLVAFVTLAIDETVVLRDVAVRRTSSGRLVLSFALRPPRRLGGNLDRRKDPRWRYALSHPYSPEVHAEIERQVIAQLRERGDLP